MLQRRCYQFLGLLLFALGSVVVGNRELMAEEEVAKNISFDTIKFEMTKGDPFERKMLTESIEKLVGKKVRIRGYILPGTQNTGLTNFILVRDNMECCFGPGAALYDCIVIEMTAGNSTNYTTRPVAIEGTFEIREFKGPDGTHLAIYHLTADKAK
jgi:hypothetical protein